MWGITGALLLLLGAVSWRPLSVGWRCWSLHAGGVHAEAEVLHKLEAPHLVLHLRGAPPGEGSCTAKTSVAHHAALEVGDLLAVVYLPERAGECELEATLRNSLFLMSGITGLFVILVAAILGTAVWIHRTVRRPVWPSTQLEAGRAPACPRCGKSMDEGSVVLLAGVHWRRLGEAMGLPHALSGLPGTVGWSGRPCLHGYRCEPCGVVTFRHGGRPAS